MVGLIDGILYSVRRSDRARRVRVRVDVTRGVEVVLPRRAPEREAAAAVRELAPWIERRLAEVQRQRSMLAARGDTLPYLGTTLALVPAPGRQRVVQRDRTLLVPEGPGRGPALERWCRRMARLEITPRVERACAQLDCGYSRLTVRDQRTRWGSCSRGGALSFNWRLLLAPEAVLEYVVWHEVCHLRVPDHSPRFWSLLAAHCPDHRRQVTWLRRNGATLAL
ncbi:MAG: M48 family metallopeptidase [Solirubrobacteraceae bacterium]